MTQLNMVWPEQLTDCPPPVDAPDGYTIRPFAAGDEAGQVKVMKEAGFETWNESQLEQWLQTALPDGVFVAVHDATGDIVATASAAHKPTDLHPDGGELGWVAGSPAHSGKGLGRAVSSAALRRHLDEDCHRVYLLTDDWRLAAIKVYLKMGFRPFVFLPDMADRWRAALGKLNMDVSEDEWM